MWFDVLSVHELIGSNMYRKMHVHRALHLSWVLVTVLLADVKSQTRARTGQRVNIPNVKIYHRLHTNNGGKDDGAQVLYDSTRKDIKDHNVTIPLLEQQRQVNSNATEYFKFRYYFECSAKEHPLEWVYEGQGVPHVHVTNERHIDLKDPMNASRYTFKSTIWFYTGDDREESASGRYICRSASDSTTHTRTTVDVFFSGRREFLADAVLENPPFPLAPLGHVFSLAGNATSKNSPDGPKCRVVHLTVYVSEDDIWLGLPCAVSKPFYRLRPKSNILLYKVNSTSGEWRYLPLNSSSLTYDPRIGFTVHRTLFTGSWNKSTYFVCASNQVKTLINITIVLRHRSVDMDPAKLPLLARAIYSFSSRQFMCVTETNGTDIAWSGSMRLEPAMGAAAGVVPCYSITHCEFTRSSLQNYITYQNPDDISNDIVDSKDVLSPDSFAYEFMESGLFYCLIPSAGENAKVNLMRAMYFYKLRADWFPIPTKGSQENVSHNVEVEVNGDLSLPSLPEDVLQVGILTPNYDEEFGPSLTPDFNHTEVIFYCEGSRLFLAEPFVWKLVRFVDKTTENEETTFKHGKMVPGRNSRSIVRSTISMDTYELASYVSIECWAPIWTSKTNWVHVVVKKQDLKSLARESNGARSPALSQFIAIACMALTFPILL